MKINNLQIQQKQKSIRVWILFFIIALVLSGLTALGIETQMRLLSDFFPARNTTLGAILWKAYDALKDINYQYPFLSYGFDWLAFAHIVIATVFIGPLQDPVRNKWVIQFGKIACCMVIPFALVMGGVRGLPLWWRLIDCSFGIIGFIPLSICLRHINQLELLQKITADNSKIPLSNKIDFNYASA